MGGLFNYDSPLMQSLNKIVDCMILSILWVIFSIPIFTVGASTTALYYTVNKVIRHNRSHIWREFWSAFKSNFKQSTVVWVILLILFYVLSVDSIFLYNLIKADSIGDWVIAPFLALFYFVVSCTLYIFPYIARFQNSLKSTVKICAILSIRHLLRSILLFLIFAASILLLIFIPITLVALPTITTLLMNFVLESIFKKYMSEEDLMAEEERNRAFHN